MVHFPPLQTSAAIQVELLPEDRETKGGGAPAFYIELTNATSGATIGKITKVCTGHIQIERLAHSPQAESHPNALAVSRGRYMLVAVTCFPSAQCSVTAVSDTSPGVFSLSEELISVTEADSHATLTLRRTDGTTGEVSCVVSTKDGSAIAPSDYVALESVPVVFKEGETEKTINVSFSSPCAPQAPNASATEGRGGSSFKGVVAVWIGMDRSIPRSQRAHAAPLHMPASPVSAPLFPPFSHVRRSPSSTTANSRVRPCPSPRPPHTHHPTSLTLRPLTHPSSFAPSPIPRPNARRRGDIHGRLFRRQGRRKLLD